ncbi:MAG: glycoside hydrolase family 3 C-terminal domain-containing protein [Muribaculaceae bacterium]|nr:glycoside hydrolase family 3 C-terminal domain-containing protein [Muribaculaceae bacterium]
MKISKILITTVIICLSAILAAAQTAVYLDVNAPVEDRVEDALKRMTLDEKIAMTHANGKFFSPGVPRLGIPGLMMSDGPHGVRAEINWNNWGYAGWTTDSATAYPALTGLAATWNRDLARRYGTSIGAEARYRGKNVLLGPGVNICRTPLNGRNFEYMGEDPYLAGELAAEYIQGVQSNGVAACVKHYALNNQEKWRDNIDVTVDERTLNELYLPAFRKAVQDGGAWSIMGAYNKVNGQHCCHNELLLNTILRGQWGFDGAVITDWGGAHDAREAALNGLDIEMGSYTNGLTTESAFTYDDYYLGKPYKQLLLAGEVPMSTLDDKARNILRLIMRTSMNGSQQYGSLASDEHLADAQAIADESVVLLKNNGILPLDPKAGKRVLVVGENATRNLCKGGGSSELKPRVLETPLEHLVARYGNVTYTPGYRSGKAMYSSAEEIPETELDSLRQVAVDLAREADVVIYIGGMNKNAYQDCEASDRADFHLSYKQDQLIAELAAANPNIIVANISGNAYAMPWLDRVPAVIQSWYPGSVGARSLAAVIAGDVNPSGKLPFSFPVRLEDNNAHAKGALSYPGIEDANGPRQEYLDGIFVGYRHHDTNRVPALFPFGYGLSYTTFSYGKPSVSSSDIVDTVTLTIPVTNTGNRPGSETVQLYVADLKSSLPRPAKELKGFKKVALEPGETANVEFVVTLDDLKFYDPARGGWIAEPGKFNLLVGASSADIRATVPIRLK